MLDAYGYERLMPQYNALYHNRKCSHTTSMTAYLPLFVIGIVLTVLFSLPSAVYGGAGIVIMPLIVIGAVYFYVSKQKAWIKTNRIIRAFPYYECTVTDCDLSVVRNYKAKNIPHNYVIYKFTYDKEGSEVTDMCRIHFVGEYAGDVTKAYIRLFEGQDGEKVISVVVPGKHEYRIVCQRRNYA